MNSVDEYTAFCRRSGITDPSSLRLPSECRLRLECSPYCRPSLHRKWTTKGLLADLLPGRWAPSAPNATEGIAALPAPTSSRHPPRVARLPVSARKYPDVLTSVKALSSLEYQVGTVGNLDGKILRAQLYRCQENYRNICPTGYSEMLLL